MCCWEVIFYFNSFKSLWYCVEGIKNRTHVRSKREEIEGEE